MPTCKYLFDNNLKLFLCKHILAIMSSMQLVWCAHLTSLWGISLCSSVKSFRGTRSAPGYYESCARFVWIGVWGWRSHFQWQIPDIDANRRSSYGYIRDIVLICMLWELSWLFWNNFVMLSSGRVGDVQGRSGTGDVSTEVETDVPASKRRAVVTRCLIPLAGDTGRPSRPDKLVLERIRELVEKFIDNCLAVFKCVVF